MRPMTVCPTIDGVTAVHPTLLSRLVREGRWTIEETCERFERTARAMGENATLSVRQLERWMDGDVVRPRAVARRVAEKLWGLPFEALLAPADSPPQPRRPIAAASAWYAEATHDHSTVPSRPDQALPAAAAADLAGDDGPPRPDTEDMNRRELLRLVAMAAASLAVPIDQERAAHAVAGAGRLDSDTVDELAVLNSHLWQVFALTSAKASILPVVRGQVAALVDNLRQSQSVPVRQRLCVLTADLLQLAGEIYFDGNRYTEAAQCYTLAATMSEDAKAFDMWACALTRHAFISVYTQTYEAAVPMLELAAGLASRGDGALSTRHWVAAVQAEAFAGLGRLDLCQQALDVAAEVQDLPSAGQPGGWLRFDGSRLAEERGTCYVALGRADLAEAALTTALGQHLSPRRRAGVLVDLALIGVQRRDLDALEAHAEAAMRLARQTGSGVIARRLVSLQAQLQPSLGDPRVHRLHQRIASVTGAFSV
jgi:tetratricopeptide (TPR) repeat protein